MKSIQKKILVIDDEAVFREATESALNSCGYSCISEEDPSEGMMRLKKETIQMVLLDIMMEPIDGWDTLFNIRSLPNGYDIPVMMSSAKKLHPDEVIRYGEIMDGFIIKPFTDDELCECVTGFFSWYTSLLKNTGAAKIQGISKEVRDTWVRLNRQVRALVQLKELLTPQLIPDENLTAEESFALRMTNITQMITEKTRERDMLRIQYPVFSL